MTKERTQRFRIIATLLCVGVIGLAAVSLVKAKNTTTAPPRGTPQISSNDERCGDAYVKMGEHLFKVPRYWLYLKADGNSIHARCKTSSDTPIEAQQVAFGHEMAFPGYVYERQGPGNLHDSSYSERVTFQLVLHLLPSNRRDFLTEIIEELESEGKTIEDLSIENNFYIYKKSVKARPYFINADGTLVAPDGRPVLLYNCSRPGDAFRCDAEFLWKENVFVKFNPIIYPPNASMDAWKDLYPLLLKQLDTYDVTYENNLSTTGGKR